jgi:hypothetical protein
MGKDVRKPLEKIFANMEWLDFGQAAKYLSVLTEARQKYDDMMGFVNQSALPCYIDFSGEQVEVIGEDADAPIAYATSKGRAKLEVPLWRNERRRSWVYATGPVISRTGEEVADARFRVAASEPTRPVLQFRAEDIHKLINPSQDKPIDARARRNIEQICAVLRDMPDLDLSKPYAIFDAMAQHAAAKGQLFPSSAETLKKHLATAALLINSERPEPPA